MPLVPFVVLLANVAVSKLSLSMQSALSLLARVAPTPRPDHRLVQPSRTLPIGLWLLSMLSPRSVQSYRQQRGPVSHFRRCCQRWSAWTMTITLLVQHSRGKTAARNRGVTNFAR